MAGIAGIDKNGKMEVVKDMLNRINHRGQQGYKLVTGDNETLGAVWPEVQTATTPLTLQEQAVWDASQPPLPDPVSLEQKQQPFALAAVTADGLFLARDPLGVRPLYYGRTSDGALCFASEVKALLEVAEDVAEFPPGSWYTTQMGFQSFSTLKPRSGLDEDKGQIAAGLRLRLEQAVCRRIDDEVMGSWLSGGLDSSAMAALARPHVKQLCTFAAGVAGAPDIQFAQEVADYLGTDHRQVIVTLDDLLAALPQVIYHLESFDALLVRSSITNFLVAQEAAQYVGSVFSGEGADELFGGYAYLKQLDTRELPDELTDITQRLHNTALQRVDRSASAHGQVAHVPFLDPAVVDYAMRIPAELKICGGDEPMEKWILRQSLVGTLPDEVLWRRKAKFWQGAGVSDLLAQHAKNIISDDDFKRERTLPHGWTLNTKEELLYYRIFREHFGDLETLSWMGRTKGSPRI